MCQKLFACHLDLKHGLWSRACLETQIRRLADLGYNAVLLEIEDKLQFRSAPGISSPDALSPAEIQSLVSFCRDLGLEVIPLVQSLGHAEYVLRKPAYAHLRESPEVDTQYDPLSREARQLIIRLFDEAIEAVQPRKWFHIGGDEAWSLGSSESGRAIAKEKGIGRLYLQHLLPLCEHLRRHGLRPMIWADMFLSHPHLLNQVPDDAMLVDWDYWTTSRQPQSVIIWGGYRKEHRNAMADTTEYAEALAKPAFRRHLHRYAQDEAGRFRPFYCTDALLGHGVRNVLVAPANSCGGDMVGTPRNDVHIPNCWHATRKGMTDGQGVLVTSWSVRHVHPEARILGTFAAAEAARNPISSFDFDAICLLFSEWMYGTVLENFPKAIRLSSPSHTLCQAYRFAGAQEDLLQGEDTYRALLDREIRLAEGPEALAQELKSLRNSHRKAADLLQRMAPLARKNQDHFSFWVEGAELSVLHLDFVLAMCEGTIFEEKTAWVQRIARYRKRSEALFAPTFTSHGLKEEMAVRYGFHELYLEKLDISAAAVASWEQEAS